jgi:hypothetical protein
MPWEGDKKMRKQYGTGQLIYKEKWYVGGENHDRI